MGVKNAGGGEILDFVGKGKKAVSYLDDSLINAYKYVPYVQAVLYVLILILMVYVILKMFNIKSPFTKKGVKSQVGYVEEIRKRDESIVRANKWLKVITEFIEKTPLAIDKNHLEYWNYNIGRAGIKIPGGYRYMKAVEFNALTQVIALISSMFSILILLFVNSILGWVLLIGTIVLANYCPLAFIRQTVKAKDMEITENFCECYLMLHYVLMENSVTPLHSVLKSYAKTTSSSEMHKFVDVCVHYIDTYGDYEATRYIANDYREIPEIVKLMRLVRQVNEGGEIKAELVGFRDELIDAQEYAIERHMNKIIAKARASFNILVPILIQAVLSAMSIYMKDLGLAKGLLG